MKEHIKVYLLHMQANGIEPHECVCEICGKGGGGQFNLDVNHIDARGMGGTKRKETIDNLMGTCRDCHLDFADKKHLKIILKKIHRYFLSTFNHMFNGRPSEKELEEYNIE